MHGRFIQNGSKENVIQFNCFNFYFKENRMKFLGIVVSPQTTTRTTKLTAYTIIRLNGETMISNHLLRQSLTLMIMQIRQLEAIIQKKQEMIQIQPGVILLETHTWNLFEF